jgi:hypothetical protein
MKSIKACADLGLRPLADLWDFVSHWFDRAEVLTRKKMAQPRYVLNCWVDTHQDHIVHYKSTEGFVRAYRPSDQLKIAEDYLSYGTWVTLLMKEADYARLH